MLVSVQLGMMYSFAGTGVVEIAPVEREDNSSLACQMMISAILSNEKTCIKGIKCDFSGITCIEQMQTSYTAISDSSYDVNILVRKLF